VAIVGRSGAGKSTLLGVLQGWHPPAQGQLFVDGRVMSEADFEALRAETAWVDPSVQLWNRSLLENLLYAAPPQPTVPLGRALEEAHLGGVIERLPGGLQAPLGEAGALLSGGEGQRIRFGRALMGSGHRLVLLDEPFRGLDRGKRGELLGRARRFWPQATLLCVTHDVEETTSFERVLVMDEGTIVEDGRPAELLADPASRYRRVLEAEHAVRTDLWQRRGWRRLHCEEGQLACDPALGEPAEAGDG
jgi:ATP-binding cassette subfamily B protein